MPSSHMRALELNLLIVSYISTLIKRSRKDGDLSENSRLDSSTAGSHFDH
jgi:hypothetical protein